MRIERNSKGNLLVWASDGTQIIFSDKATRTISLFQNTQEVMEACMHALFSELEYHEEEREQDCDLEEDIIEIQEHISDLSENQERLFNEIISIRNDILTMNFGLNIMMENTKK
jgi:hypothetical protein